jgi:hypothetical protein
MAAGQNNEEGGVVAYQIYLQFPVTRSMAKAGDK